MNTYFSRHTHDLDIDSATRTTLWNKQLVAIHYPEDVMGKVGERDNTSLEPEAYPNHRARALRALLRLAEEGGYVCAQYGEHEECVIGKVMPGTEIKLLYGKWGNLWGNDGREAILKYVPLQQVIVVDPSYHRALAQALTNRPRRGTLQRWWQDGGVIQGIIEGELVRRSVSL
ncbi:MAG: hypothetical protein M3Y13_05435 [Armatimonadota bacterium]|nr:hypothetical protein [Armatimonadota bacterium]